MTPAPASGRTADENELREEISRCLWEHGRKVAMNSGPHWHDLDKLEMEDRLRRMQVLGFSDALLSGPLAPILQEAATARKERDEARQLHRWNIDQADGEVLVCRGLHEKGEDCDRERFVPEDRLIAAEAEAAQLRSRLLEAEKGAEAMRKALKPFADVCDADHMRWIKDEQVLELSTRAEVPVSEKLRGRDFRAARAALAAKAAPLPDSDTGGRDA